MKNLLLSGWFQMQPFLKYIALVIIITPVLAASGHSTSAKQLSVAKITDATREQDKVSTPKAVENQPEPYQELKADQTEKLESVPSVIAVAPQVLQQDKMEPQAEDESVSVSTKIPDSETLLSVEPAPVVVKHDSALEKKHANQLDLVQRLKAAKIQSASKDVLERPELQQAESLPANKGLQTKSSTTVPVPDEAQQQQDPVGSPYPIPWKWIQATQETISSKGGSGVRYYRSVPVMSPDGRYAIYSRVKLEVKPEMYNSRVTSVLFVEDRQTKKLEIISSTAPINDPLLKANVSSADSNTQGTIEVLVPVSWSEKGDRFLARKFEALMNTSDLRDHAVIWDRQNHHSQSVTPAEEKQEHEIAVLLGWSKARPDQVLFQTGEMGDENLSLVTVAHDGYTAVANTTDQPVTYGQKIVEVWAGPPVASR